MMKDYFELFEKMPILYKKAIARKIGLELNELSKNIMTMKREYYQRMIRNQILAKRTNHPSTDHELLNEHERIQREFCLLKKSIRELEAKCEDIFLISLDDKKMMKIAEQNALIALEGCGLKEKKLFFLNEIEQRIGIDDLKSIMSLSSEDDIKELCTLIDEKIEKKFYDEKIELGFEEAERNRNKRFKETEFIECEAEFLLDNLMTAHEKRTSNEYWQFKQLRKRQKVARSELSALLKTTGRNSIYVDDFQFQTWKAKEARNNNISKTVILEVENPTNKFEEKIKFSLFDAREMGEKAQVNRIFCMTKGIESAGIQRKLVPVFITITLPGEWHPNPLNSGLNWNNENTPHKAVAEINRIWNTYRKYLNKAKIKPLGMKVIEPHKDGTPHMHLMLYFEQDDLVEADRLLVLARPETNQNRERVGTQFKIFDTENCKVSSYMMKYIKKSLNHKIEKHTDDENLEDGDHLTNHSRVRAWASENNVRRFSFIGINGSQRIFQRLYNISIEKLEDMGAKAFVLDAKNFIEKAKKRDDKAGFNFYMAMSKLGFFRFQGRTRNKAKLDYDIEKNFYNENVKKAVRIKFIRDNIIVFNLSLKGFQYKMTVVVNLPRSWEANNNVGDCINLDDKSIIEIIKIAQIGDIERDRNLNQSDDDKKILMKNEENDELNSD
jgi:hypothetical protein